MKLMNDRNVFKLNAYFMGILYSALLLYLCDNVKISVFNLKPLIFSQAF